MSNLFISLIIGLAAATIDVIPMIIKKLNITFTLSAFLFWLILGILIPRTSISSISWLNGILTSLLVLFPMAILIFKLDPEALPIICATTIVLGATVGYISSLLLR